MGGGLDSFPGDKNRRRWSLFLSFFWKGRKHTLFFAGRAKRQHSVHKKQIHPGPLTHFAAALEQKERRKAGLRTVEGQRPGVPLWGILEFLCFLIDGIGAHCLPKPHSAESRAGTLRDCAGQAAHLHSSHSAAQFPDRGDTNSLERGLLGSFLSGFPGNQTA